MAGQDNGLTNVSLPFAQLNSALQEYVNAPMKGLMHFQQALLSVKNVSLPAISSPLYQRQFVSLVSAVDGLLAVGSPYFEEYHRAFLSATDALFQVMIANQFGAERSRQLEGLLSSDRACWVLIASLNDSSSTSPVYGNYEAEFDSISASGVKIDTYFDDFSHVGNVSFQLDSAQNGRIKGRFWLVTVQSLTWLKMTFPHLHWRLLSRHDDTPLKALCEASFLPLFQNLTMHRDSRYRLLSMFESRFKRQFYQSFGAFFLTQDTSIHHSTRLVPSLVSGESFEVQNGYYYYPMRQGGSVYIGRAAKHEDAAGETYLACLGHDYLSYRLYEVETPNGKCVFPHDECLGRYRVTDLDVYCVGQTWWFHCGSHLDAEIVLSMPLSETDRDAFCFLMSDVEHVLLVQQGHRFFAVPYVSIRDVEGVCSRMPSQRSWAKNIWVNPLNQAMVEPWLFDGDPLFEAASKKERMKFIQSAKNGYYFVNVCGRMFWVEASLVLSVLPYQVPQTIIQFTDAGTERVDFLVHDGHCVDRILSGATFGEELAVSSAKAAFTLILEWQNESILVSCSSCDWHDNVPDYDVAFDDISSLLPTSEEGGMDFLSSALSSEMLINKKNYLSFVAGVWPSFSLA